MSQIIETFAEVSDHYDAAFVDIWGCVHNGLTPFEEAVACLQAYRQRGGKVVLVTNAPRHRHALEVQLDKIGVARDCWDTIATSGDSARYAAFNGAIGEKVWFLGQPHDLNFFDPLSLVQDPLELQRVELEEATGILCCGPRDPLADPEVNRPEFLYAKQKGLKLLCANPDIVVDRGETREWCAGALAQLYSEMGGESLYFGKPHPPIYDLARQRLFALGVDIPDAKIVCIGDGVLTDVRGAMGEDLDSVFISGGLAAAETRTERQPDAEALSAYLNEEMVSPTYSIGKLR